MKKVIELVVRDDDDPLRHLIGYGHKLVSRYIDDNDPLYERFKDTRTAYEQYCAGERYLKYDDETLYSKAAHEWSNEQAYRNQLPPRKNYKIPPNLRMSWRLPRGWK